MANTLLHKQLQKGLLILLFGSLLFFINFDQSAFANSANDSVEDYFNSKNQSDKQTEEKDTTRQQEEKESPTSKELVGITFVDVLKTIFALIFVVALLYFLLKWIQKKSRSYQSTKLLENLGGTQLGGNKSVQLVRVGQKILVVGVGENIQLLSEISDEKEVEEMIQKYSERFEQPGQQDVFGKFITKLKEWNNPKKQEPTKFKHLFNQQLKEMSKRRKELYDDIEKKGPNNR